VVLAAVDGAGILMIGSDVGVLENGPVAGIDFTNPGSVIVLVKGFIASLYSDISIEPVEAGFDVLEEDDDELLEDEEEELLVLGATEDVV